MTIQFTTSSQPPESTASPCVVVGVYEERLLTSAAAKIDEKSSGAIKKLVDSGDITGKIGSTTLLFAVPHIAAQRVLVVGLGEQKKFDPARFRRANEEAAKVLKTLPIANAISYLTEVEIKTKDLDWKLRQAALATDIYSYKYISTFKPKDKPKTEQFAALAFAASKNTPNALAEAEAIAEAVRLTRELGNLPPNICTPAYLAETAKKIANDHSSVSVEVLERDAMQKLGMGALLGVAQGSANPPKLIVLRYQGADKKSKPFALVGKGITFDTGGISLKPGAGMEEMKFDMCGAASVLGAFQAVAQLKLKLNLICVVPAAENMPDGNAIRPSDILTTMSGQTVEVLNTDAEGRLILCDALTYVQRFEPQVIIDVATLTGACVTALGKHASGLMSKDDELADQLLAAGNTTLDRAWRLPLWEDYQSQLDTGYADIANMGGKTAGAITAACFLARFTEGYRWAHLDIAGTAWDEGRKGNATGRPVPLLVQYLLDRCAS